MDDRLHLDVCGQVYAIPVDVIENGPPSRLKQICKSKSEEHIVINRPPEYFPAILAFYQTGELHIPMTSCPGAFISELEYWEISQDFISDCCYNRLRSFLDEQHTLRRFKESLQDEKTSHSSYFYLKTARAKLWQTVDYTTPTLIGKIYFILSIFMVLLSISVLAYSTDPSFQRTMNNCERLEYMASSDIDGYNIVKPYLEKFCSDSNLPELSTNYSQNGNANETFELVDQNDGNEENNFLSYVFRFVRENVRELNNSEGTSDPNEARANNELGKTTDSTRRIEEENITNFVAFGNETYYFDEIEPNNESRFSNTSVMKFTRGFISIRPPDDHILGLLFETKYVNIPNLKIKFFILVILEGLTTVYFTGDILLRLFSCPGIRLYFFSIINCADALSLIGAYLYFLLYYMFPHLRYDSWINNLSYIQMLRSFRLFRIVSNVRAGKVFAYTARENMKDLLILILFLIAGMCTFASIFYVTEDNTTVESIPDAWYWAVITMTTVGYGDIQPETKVGRLLACVCAVVGVILLALTVPIFANHFLVLYQHVESENIVRRIQKRDQPPAVVSMTVIENHKANGANITSQKKKT